jgi:hypothetical protein
MPLQASGFKTQVRSRCSALGPARATLHTDEVRQPGNQREALLQRCLLAQRRTGRAHMPCHAPQLQPHTLPPPLLT